MIQILKISALFLVITVGTSMAQSSYKFDTLKFESIAFNQSREVWVHLPPDYIYQSKEVRLPVIYLLDGQHDWFIEPVLGSIKALNSNYEIPSAIVVIIPLVDRNQECSFNGIKGTKTKLQRMIIEELEPMLKKYNPGTFRMIIGHSFSASFSLYSFLESPGFFQALIAHSPMDELDTLIFTLNQLNPNNAKFIGLSVGGAENDKDGYHHKRYQKVKAKYPALFKKICLFEADGVAHNAVPTVTNAYLMARIFHPFSRRFNHIATVNENYEMINKPLSPEKEWTNIEKASLIGNIEYPPEISELNGIASRFSQSNYVEHAKLVYLKGINFYPNYYGWYASLYELSKEKSKEEADMYIKKAKELILTYEKGSNDFQDLISAVESEEATLK